MTFGCNHFFPHKWAIYEPTWTEFTVQRVILGANLLFNPKATGGGPNGQTFKIE